MHLLLMIVFAVVIAAVMAVVEPAQLDPRARLLYGLKVFAAFVGVAIVLGWLMYFIPF